MLSEIPKKSVLVSLTTEAFYPVLPGGLAQTFRYAPGLRDRGVQLRVHTPLLPEHENETELSVNGIEIHRHLLNADLPNHHYEREALVRLALAAMRRERRPVAQCLQPNGVTWETTRMLWRARLQGLSSVLYATMYPEDPAPQLIKRLRGLVRMWINHSPYSQIITCSRRIKEAYHQQAGIPQQRLQVLPNGIDLRKFSPTDTSDKEVTALREKIGLPTAGPIVLYSGSMTPRKGVDILLEAWRQIHARIPAARLVMLGSIGRRPTFRDRNMLAELDTFTQRLKQIMAALPAPDSVIMPGEVTDVTDFYRVADVFAFPSHREGLPNSVLEAMACGVPSVIAPFAGIPADGEEFGNAGEHYVRTQHTPSAMATDVLDLLSDPTKRRSIGTAARHWMERNQGIEGTLDILANIYHSVAKILPNLR